MMKHIAAVLPDIIEKEENEICLCFVYFLFRSFWVRRWKKSKIPFNFLFLQRPTEVTEKAGVKDPRDNLMK